MCPTPRSSIYLPVAYFVHGLLSIILIYLSIYPYIAYFLDNSPFARQHRGEHSARTAPVTHTRKELGQAAAACARSATNTQRSTPEQSAQRNASAGGGTKFHSALFQATIARSALPALKSRYPGPSPALPAVLGPMRPRLHTLRVCCVRLGAIKMRLSRPRVFRVPLHFMDQFRGQRVCMSVCVGQVILLH